MQDKLLGTGAGGDAELGPAGPMALPEPHFPCISGPPSSDTWTWGFRGLVLRWLRVVKTWKATSWGLLCLTRAVLPGASQLLSEARVLAGP